MSTGEDAMAQELSATPWTKDDGAPPLKGRKTAEDALLRDLRRRGGSGEGWGVIWTAILGFLTFGIAPAIAWAFALRDQIDGDRALYTRTADWFRFHSVHPEAGRLRAAAERMYGRPFLSVLPIVCCAVVFLFFLTSLDGRRDRIRAARWATHQYPYLERVHAIAASGFNPSAYDQRDRLFLAWLAGTSAAYLSICLAVSSHAASVWRFADAFRALAAAERLRQPASIIPPQPVVRWWVGAAVLTWLGLAWAPTAMVAAASRRRLATCLSVPLRADLAEAVSEMRRLRQTPVRMTPLLQCTRPHCAASLPAGARFCRRCGAAVLPATVPQWSA